MSETTPPVSIANVKDVRIVEFTNNKILDEANIADIGATLNALIDEKTQPKLLLDFANVEHLSSAALGMLINVNNRVKAALARSSLLFVGYSQNDWSFRVLMRTIQLTGANLGRLNIAVQLNPAAKADQKPKVLTIEASAPSVT